MKVLKHKNLMSLFYCVLMALPLCSILGRVLYTQWNKNAKDSYYGETINESLTTLLELDTKLDTNNKYKMVFTYNSNTYVNYTYTFSEVNLISVNNTSYTTWLENAKSIAFTRSSNVNQLVITRTNNTQAFVSGDSLTTLKFELNFIPYDNLKIVNADTENMLYLITYNKYSYLDNAFSYSVSQIIEDNNFGNINFVGLLSNLFLDQTNSVNAMYLNFVNWYMNYALFISVVYILFLVLMWFINWIRQLLERGMDFGKGAW